MASWRCHLVMLSSMTGACDSLAQRTPVGSELGSDPGSDPSGAHGVRGIDLRCGWGITNLGQKGAWMRVRMRVKLLVGLVAALCLIASACGGDDDAGSTAADGALRRQRRSSQRNRLRFLILNLNLSRTLGRTRTMTPNPTQARRPHLIRSNQLRFQNPRPSQNPPPSRSPTSRS